MVRPPGPSVPGQPVTSIARGDIWLVVLDPAIGSEIQKTRPCVVVSPLEMNDHLRTVLAAPMTTGSRSAPFRIPLRFQQKHGLILLDQIRALDKQRLVRRLGTVESRTLRLTLERLQDLFVE